jgi:hypothetical protein
MRWNNCTSTSSDRYGSVDIASELRLLSFWGLIFTIYPLNNTA